VSRKDYVIGGARFLKDTFCLSKGGFYKSEGDGDIIKAIEDRFTLIDDHIIEYMDMDNPSDLKAKESVIAIEIEYITDCLKLLNNKNIIN
jgi:hypothetical protein